MSRFDRHERKVTTGRVALSASFAAALGVAGIISFVTGEAKPVSKAVTPETCRAISRLTGKVINPIGYPIGPVNYTWEPSFNHVDKYVTQTDPGTIEASYDESSYRLVMPSLLPKSLNGLAKNGTNGDYGQNIAIAVDDTKTGVFGLTDDCIHVVDMGNTSTIYAVLPIASK